MDRHGRAALTLELIEQAYVVTLLVRRMGVGVVEARHLAALGL